MMLHTPLAIERQGTDIKRVSFVNDSKEDSDKVAVFLIEIDRQSSDKDIKQLEKEIESVLGDVAAAVNDWRAMSDKLAEVAEELPKRPFPGEKAELEEATRFLNYLNNHHFTLMGYRRYDLRKVEGDVELVPDMASSLGLMNKPGKAQPEHGLMLSSFSESARREALDNSLLILTKSSAKSRFTDPPMSTISASNVSMRPVMSSVKTDSSACMLQSVQPQPERDPPAGRESPASDGQVRTGTALPRL